MENNFLKLAGYFIQSNTLTAKNAKSLPHGTHIIGTTNGVLQEYKFLHMHPLLKDVAILCTYSNNLVFEYVNLFEGIDKKDYMICNNENDAKIIAAVAMHKTANKLNELIKDINIEQLIKQHGKESK